MQSNILNANSNVAAENISVCFTPPSGCAEVIAAEINKARESIYLEAYGFTPEIIIKQLIKSSNRGLKVRTILDRSNFSDKKKLLVEDLRNIGIEISRRKLQVLHVTKLLL